LDDETTAYYWAVIPVNGLGTPTLPIGLDHPQAFNKSSVPPTLLTPINGVSVSDQPTFKWTAAEGAVNYTLQVSENPTFATLLDNVKTDATAFTSSTTYPANETLYWRVRANDAAARNEGLNWSPTQTFRRTLPAPAWDPANPAGGEAIPALAFAPVIGATSYDVHVELSDGTTKDFSTRSTVFTAGEWDGPGIFRFSARAEFPTANSQSIPGAYTAPFAFAHKVAPPTGVTAVRSGKLIVISWHPQAYAHQYLVELSQSSSFTRPLESKRIETASWAPAVNLARRKVRGTLYWRVAAVDKRGNVGGYAAGSFVPPRAKCSTHKKSHGAKRCISKRGRKDSHR
ncbi:MAG TPA: hypothetical protein VH025_05590, partial [Solirubrobacteraceae bacterium]|nr:hypothetical protein [Solirubrobacteraceae bacterium]